MYLPNELSVGFRTTAGDEDFDLHDSIKGKAAFTSVPTRLSAFAGSFTNCTVDFNRFRVREGQPWLVDAGKKLWPGCDVKTGDRLRADLQ